MKLYAQRDASSAVDSSKPVSRPSERPQGNRPEAIPAEPLPAGMPQDEF